ncbi:MAG: beta-propeller fold lactonase family protein, partial [Gemmatimonadales bacterium]|nr:beta-propeller fold lactonase family protein [Gemmatimonadales bacterium]
MRRALLLSTLAATLAAIGLTACSDTTRPNDAQLAAAGHDVARGRPGTTGAVYVQTNSAGENHVVIYQRSADGQLQHGQAVRTGGRGTGLPRLGSQGSVILSADNHWLLVCNVGSDQISVFAVNDRGLTLTDLASSGGRMPLSLTLHGDLLY